MKHFFQVSTCLFIIIFCASCKNTAPTVTDETAADIVERCNAMDELLKNSQESESFIFMTDPHLLGYQDQFDVNPFNYYIGVMKRYSDSLPVNFVICGGDWLNCLDTQGVACYKLKYMNAKMYAMFNRYYPCLGNHDTNYQGVMSTTDDSRGDLSHETLTDLMFSEIGNTYYEFNGNSTRFFVLDTGIDWSNAMNEFRYSQAKWMCDKLLDNTQPNIIIIMHIYFNSGSEIAPMAECIHKIAGAFNDRKAIEVDGAAYDFSKATGKIRCIMSGHSHRDWLDTESSVPVVITTNMMDGEKPTFDVVVADYTNHAMHLLRVGTGEDRTISLP